MSKLVTKQNIWTIKQREKKAKWIKRGGFFYHKKEMLIAQNSSLCFSNLQLKDSFFLCMWPRSNWSNGQTHPKIHTHTLGESVSNLEHDQQHKLINTINLATKSPVCRGNSKLFSRLRKSMFTRERECNHSWTLQLKRGNKNTSMRARALKALLNVSL